MDGCGQAGEAQGILQGSFDERFSATFWESCATSSRLRHKYGVPASGSWPPAHGLRLVAGGSRPEAYGRRLANNKSQQNFAFGDIG